MYTIYAYWNAEQVRVVLNAIAIIMNGDDYLGLVKAIAIAGILVAAGTALVRMRGEEPAAYFIMFALFYGTLFVPKATVTVQDLRTPTVYTVANVPMGVALFASETSHIGKWLTETFETNFTAIDDEKFSKTGMAFGSRLVEELQMVKVRTPNLTQSLIAFVKDCVNPEFLDNPTTLDEMVRATDLWGYIGGSGTFQLNPGRFTSFPGGTYACTGPGGAYSILTTMLNAEVDRAAADMGSRLNAGHPLASTIILSQIPAIESSMLNVSRTAQEAIKQGMVMNIMRDSQTTIAQLQGNPQAAQIAMAVATAEESSKVSYAAMAKVAEGALPKLRNAIELIVIAIFPVIFVIIVLAGIKAGLVLKSYVMAVFWVQLWAPLYAVINFITNGSNRSDFLGVLNTAGGNNIENMSLLANTALSNSSITGLLTISVPIIALALVKGGEVAMSGVVSSVMTPAQKAAQTSGDAIGQGNLTAGNVSWGNVNTSNWSGGNWSGGNRSFGNVGANKQDWSSLNASSALTTNITPYGSYQTDGVGNITGMQANSWGMGGTTGGGTNLGRSDIANSSTGVKAATGRTASLDISSAAFSGDSSRAEFARQFSTALATRLGKSGTWGQRWEAGASGTASNERAGQTQLANSEGMTWGSRARADAGVSANQTYGPYGTGTQGAPSSGAPAGAPASKAGPVSGNRSASLDVGTGMSVDTGQRLIDMATNRSGSVDQKSQQQAAQIVMAAVNDVIRNTNDSGVRGAAQAFSAEFQNAVRAGDQRTASVSSESAAGNTKQQGTSNQVGGSFAIGKPVADQLMSMARAELGPGASNDQVAQRALQMAADPAAVAAATAAAADGLKNSAAGGAVLGAGGAQAPATPAAVQTKGNADVAALAGQGKGAVQSANAGNKAAVAAKQPASPTSIPDTSAATGAYTSTASVAYSAYRGFKGDAALNKGAMDAANALYQAEQKGTGTVLSNTFLGGWGYQSPQEYQAAITEAAAARPKLADTLRRIGDGGGKVSPGALEFIQSEVKAYKDSK